MYENKTSAQQCQCSLIFINENITVVLSIKNCLKFSLANQRALIWPMRCLASDGARCDNWVRVLIAWLLTRDPPRGLSSPLNGAQWSHWGTEELRHASLSNCDPRKSERTTPSWPLIGQWLEVRASDWLRETLQRHPWGWRAMFKCDDTAVFYSIQGFHTIKLCTITKRAGQSERILFYCR